MLRVDWHRAQCQQDQGESEFSSLADWQPNNMDIGQVVNFQLPLKQKQSQLGPSQQKSIHGTAITDVTKPLIVRLRAQVLLTCVEIMQSDSCIRQHTDKQNKIVVVAMRVYAQTCRSQYMHTSMLLVIVMIAINSARWPWTTWYIIRIIPWRTYLSQWYVYHLDLAGYHSLLAACPPAARHLLIAPLPRSIPKHPPHPHPLPLLHLPPSLSIPP